MIKLVYLSPVIHDGFPKNPGDTKFFDETNLDSLKELKSILSISNPLSNKVSIVPEHQQIYQLALSYYDLEGLPLSTTHTSVELLTPLEIEGNNPFISETQVAVKRIQSTPITPEEENINAVEELVDIPLISSIEDIEIKEIESQNYSLVDEVNARRKELDSTHHTKIKNLAEQYGLTYTNKDSAVKAILYKEFEETALSLGQESVLNN